MYNIILKGLYKLKKMMKIKSEFKLVGYQNIKKKCQH